MTILQFTAKWTGFTGSPGYTQFHITNAGLLSTALNNGSTGMRKFFDDMKVHLCSNTHILVSPEVKELDPATGALIALHAVPSPATEVVGTGGSDQSPGPVGAVVSWGTGGVNRGRAVRGRTFIVPIYFASFFGDGTLTSACVTSMNTAATNWRTSGGYESLIWSRPRAGAGGAAFPILTSAVPDMAAVLRSRRD